MEENIIKDEDSGSEDAVYENEEEGLKSDAEKLRKKLKECREEKEKYLAGWQLAQADFINYRRRQEEQQVEWSRIYGEGLIRDILPALDSLDAALAAKPDDEGLKTFSNQVRAILKRHGLQEMKVIGEKFDPNMHEVVDCEEGGEKQSGETVSGEIQKGYLLNGKLLRAAKVKVKK